MEVEGGAIIMKNLILIRHGETVWNTSFKYQGHTDIALNENGMRQAELLANKLSTEEFHAIYASDLIRAKKTAEIIAKHHKLKVVTSQRLREICFGQWEGLTYSQIKGKDPDLLQQWVNNPVALRIPEGETFVELYERVGIFIEEVIPKHNNQRVVIVAHGGTIAALICYLLRININKMWDYKIGNTAVTTFKLENKQFVLENHNDTTHLG